MAKLKLQWKIQKKKLDELKPFEKNPRELTKSGMADLKTSVDNFGIAEPIVINKNTNEIIGGHARFFTLKEMKVSEVDCYIPERQLTKQEVKELNIRLNKNIAGTWDFDILANDFELTDLLQWGFTERELFKYDNDNAEIKDSLGAEENFSIKIKCESEGEMTQVMQILKIKKQIVKFEDFLKCQTD